ncbi:alpha/beta-hydrolase [Piedraia hortae CBS 480.64]|uniref:Palmitoyl-protein thioesterase 1 n=1 Tax=Piedraia hortae CBS 480.64 TaxID=1314780 RepID=A0A6A7C3H6_9PEZI|nr:alpha/beta-hydrolase [Piedraia hortae CBS 480.64]
MRLPTLLLPLALPTLATSPLPLIIWHGLGDTYTAPGLHEVGQFAQKTHPGTYIHYIHLSDDSSRDRSSSFLGNITTQLTTVCAQLHSNKNLLSRDGKTLRVDALGFSQGGQLLRGLLQRCEGLSIRSLVTFGSQHNGITQFQACGAYDVLCKGAMALVGAQVWGPAAQGHVVPAQYFRPVDAKTGHPPREFFEYSNFLADVNNERESKDWRYKTAIAGLEQFVMFVFGEDELVVPKESGWFGEVNVTTGEVVSVREREVYKRDWLGLRVLDERGGLVFRTTPGRHMELTGEVIREVCERYFGGERAVGFREFL